MGPWRISIGVLLGCLLAVGAWTANRAATASDRHPTRPEFEQVQETIRTNQQTIERKIDNITNILINIRGQHGNSKLTPARR
jgi:hypothetical protein